MMQPLSRGDAAAQLREQAAACRRLAKRAQSKSSSSALTSVAEQFDDDARRVDSDRSDRDLFGTPRWSTR